VSVRCPCSDFTYRVGRFSTESVRLGRATRLLESDGSVPAEVRRFALPLVDGHLRDPLVAVAGLLRRRPRPTAAGRGAPRTPDRLGAGEHALTACGRPPSDAGRRRRGGGGRRRQLTRRRGPGRRRRRRAGAVGERDGAGRVVVGVREIEVVEARRDERRRLVGAPRSTLGGHRHARRRQPADERHVLTPAEPPRPAVSTHHARRAGNTRTLLHAKSPADHDHGRI